MSIGESLQYQKWENVPELTWPFEDQISSMIHLEVRHYRRMS